MQVIIDNKPQYKTTRDPNGALIPCTAYYIDLTLMDTEKIHRVQNIVDLAQSITRFIHNRKWVLSLMRSYTGRYIQTMYHTICYQLYNT